MAPFTKFFEDISLRLGHLSKDDENENAHNFSKNINSRSSSESGSNNNSSHGHNPGMFPCCFISNNDPRASYTGVWTLNGTQFSTQHITTDPGSSVSLSFTGAGIAVFGVIPLSNDTFKPPTALYFLDGELTPPRALPFATTNIPNQPLFSTTTVLDIRQHTLVINITNAPTPYTLQSFFVPDNDSTAKDMISGHIPSMSNGTLSPGPDSSNITHTANSTKASMTASSQKSTPTASNEMASLERTVRILSGILGALILLILVILVLGAIYKCRSRRWTSSEAKETKDGRRRETMFSGWLTSTESILRNDSDFRSPPRTPRSLYSRRSEPRSGRSPSVGPLSMTDGSQAPPLPPKASILIMSP